MNQPSMSRRSLIQASGLASVALGLPAFHRFAAAQSSKAYQPTPSQSEGPFYPDQQLQDADFDLLRNGNVDYLEGQAAWVSGVVTDLQGKPISGATVEIWQCDHDGFYRHSASSGRRVMAFQGFGRTMAAADGSYKFRTIKPVAYPGRPPHIHFKVKLGQRELLTTQMYVQGERANARDFLTRSLSADQRSLLEAAFTPSSDGLQAQFPIRVAA